ncbi:MAG: FkbM family methyltransferase [Anaerolineae bacterium]|nr:FkbM family methyltransferase [Anaerolineae bacterium]
MLRKLYYDVLPNRVKKFIFTAARRVYSPSPALRNVLYFEGDFAVTTNSTSFLMSHTGNGLENKIFWKGLYGHEAGSMQLWQRLCEAANIILDIGSNTGLYTLVAKSVNPSARVYAFEPLSQFASTLKHNVKLNNFDIKIYEYAISDFIGEAEFYSPKPYHGNIYSSTLSTSHYQNHQTSTPLVSSVNVKTLDEIVKEERLENIDLIKIDAEGHDHNVLKGFSSSLTWMSPDFLIEIQNPQIGAAIEEVLAGKNYVYINIDDSLSNTFQKLDFLSPAIGRNFLICKQSTSRKLKLI